MSTRGFEGFYVGTRNYGATVAFWRSLGFTVEFETGHGSGQLRHPSGGPFVFVAEVDALPEIHPVLGVDDAATFSPERPVEYVSEFEPQHWGVLEAVVRDPDGRLVRLSAPMPEGMAPLHPPVRVSDYIAGRFAEAFNENLIFWNGTKVAPDLIAALQHAFQQGGWPACANHLHQRCGGGHGVHLECQ